jgi:hypothetical protein
VSIDAQDYYPSVWFKLVQQAVEYYSQSNPAEMRELIDTCLLMIDVFNFHLLNIDASYSQAARVFLMHVLLILICFFFLKIILQ